MWFRNTACKSPQAASPTSASFRGIGKLSKFSPGRPSCIEVLSKDDTLRSMQDRVDDDVAFGVPNIWVLNPVKRRAHVCSFRDFREPENGILEVANSPIGISLADLFADLD